MVPILLLLAIYERRTEYDAVSAKKKMKLFRSHQSDVRGQFANEAMIRIYLYLGVRWCVSMEMFSAAISIIIFFILIYQ